MTDKFTHLTDHQLHSYLDGALDLALSDDLLFHLDHCPECQLRLARLEELTVQLNNLPELPLSRDLSNKVVSRLQEERQLSPGVTLTLVLEALGAGIVIGIMIPAIRAAGGLKVLLLSRGELAAALNIYLTQLASNWLVWWTQLQLQISHITLRIKPLVSQPLLPFSPWILVGAAGGLGILINYLLLSRQPRLGRNHNQH